MLKYWPVTNPNKEIIFLNEIEEVSYKYSEVHPIEVANMLCRS